MSTFSSVCCGLLLAGVMHAAQTQSSSPLAPTAKVSTQRRPLTAPLRPGPSKSLAARQTSSPLAPSARRIRSASLASALRPLGRPVRSFFALSSPLSPATRAAHRSTLGMASPLLPMARSTRSVSSAQQTPPTKPIIVFEPADTTLTLDARGFASTKIRFKNVGAGKLTIARLTPSCGCASASVQRNAIDSTGTGMFLIGVNGKNASDTQDVVEWIVESNATVPSAAYRVRIQRSATTAPKE